MLKFSLDNRTAIWISQIMTTFKKDSVDSVVNENNLDPLIRYCGVEIVI